MNSVITTPMGNSLIVKLNRPEKRNAFNLELTLRTKDTVALGCRDYSGVIITGEGRVFSQVLT
ncbi:enoyl-CoA hydratase/isomerase family protein [Vulcanisaeta sp. JCM 14467]|uniref:enoyl-CoA hydratase/isomerase family protein n=1 Tax=Vulcanisaeta sp. JCM 14467 TaxID=1295370 RepID=UPI0006D25462|nr:enoyl-CoA hydratase/isomerase family protein [Vulcanisaeta sp. JCM 14467]